MIAILTLYYAKTRPILSKHFPEVTNEFVRLLKCSKMTATVMFAVEDDVAHSLSEAENKQFVADGIVSIV